MRFVNMFYPPRKHDYNQNIRKEAESKAACTQTLEGVEAALSFSYFSNKDFFLAAATKKSLQDFPTLTIPNENASFESLKKDFCQYQKNLLAYKKSTKTIRERQPMIVESYSKKLTIGDSSTDVFTPAPSTSSGASLKATGSKLSRNSLLKTPPETSALLSDPDIYDFDMESPPRPNRASKARACNLIENFAIQELSDQDDDVIKNRKLKRRKSSPFAKGQK